MSSLAAASSTKITLETKRAFRRRRRCRHRWRVVVAFAVVVAVAVAGRATPHTDKNNFRLRTRRFLCANWQPLGSTYNCCLPPFF